MLIILDKAGRPSRRLPLLVGGRLFRMENETGKMKQGKFMRLTEAQIAWLAATCAGGRSQANVIGELIDRAATGVWLPIPKATLAGYQAWAAYEATSLEHKLLRGLESGLLRRQEPPDKETDPDG